MVMTPPPSTGPLLFAHPDAGAREPAWRPLGFAVGAMGGQILNPHPGAEAVPFRGAAYDSRGVRPGRLFFALPGARVDGFDFCAEAEAQGAAALVVAAARGLPGAPGIPVVAVADPLAALAALARAARAAFTGAVVAITGSNGKTTTKELCAAALGTAGPVLRTAGSLNTEVGLPITILEAVGDEGYWVLELAMRGRGQIAALTEIARPDVGVITNVGAAHLELLGSLEEVARAKGELFAGLGANAIAILPGGDPLIEAEAAHIPEARKLRFQGSERRRLAATERGGFHGDVDLDVEILGTSSDGVGGQRVTYRVKRETVTARLPLVGVHNARNGAAALAVASALGVSPWRAAEGLSAVVLPPHRSHAIAAGGRTVLDDCYNANPGSMRAGLAMLVATATAPRRAYAVLGDMLELGPDSEELHRALGREVGPEVTGLGVVGELARHIAAGAEEAGLDPARIVVGQDPAAVAETVAGWTVPGDVILVKASRGARLERAVEALRAKLGAQPDTQPDAKQGGEADV
jgi:UDP-N-acetylmuramoyl-tripeptide--D-alanyl-D-alanine ligase